MEYFVIQVATGKEENFLKLANYSHPDIYHKLLWLRKELTIKKGGKLRKKVSSIFPGYIFYESEFPGFQEVSRLRQIPGFCRFLQNNNDIRPLPENERRLIYKMLSGGQIAGESKVYFDINNRIKVIEGPMKDLEGEIIKVDKRKKRAKIKLKLYENSFTIDFGFKTIELLKEENPENGK